MSVVPGIDAISVSRETREKLTIYARLLERWGRRINLVSRATLPDRWRRHFLDSAQLLDLAPPTARSWIDLGSGGGFPGMVVAILVRERGLPIEMTLVEADGRKCAFLEAVARETDTKVTILPVRIETLQSAPHDVVSARALAPLEALLPLAAPLCAETGICLLPKGRTAVSELTAVEDHWTMTVRSIPSRTDRDGVVLAISKLGARS